MLDRTKQPTIYPIANLSFIAPKTQQIGQSRLVEFKGGDKEVIRLRVVFNAGTKQHENPVIPVAVNALMKEGTKNYTAAALADKLDYYGAFLHSEIDKDRSWIELYCLSKHVNSVMPLFTEIIREATFSAEEWGIYKTNAIQNLKQNQQKVSFLAKSKLQEVLFEGHPYGTVVEESHYQAVSELDLQAFYAQFITNKIVQVELVGQFTEEHKNYLTNALHLEEQQVLITGKKNETPMHPAKAIHIPKKDAVQCAISIGSIFPGRTHPDYFGVKVLVCALGGYFGSRLMANVREDKGYTYGIGAGVGAYQDFGVINISTEVGVAVKDAALHEIYYELDRLVNEPIPEDELTLVKNYMKGSLLKQCDGLFSQADLWHVLSPFNLDFEYFEAYMQVINKITAKELQTLADKYLHKKYFTEVVAGGTE